MTDSKETSNITTSEPTLEHLVLYKMENAHDLRYERVLFHRLNDIVIRATGHDLVESLSTLDKLEFMRRIVDYHQSIDPDFRDDYSGNFFDLLK